MNSKWRDAPQLGGLTRNHVNILEQIWVSYPLDFDTKMREQPKRVPDEYKNYNMVPVSIEQYQRFIKLPSDEVKDNALMVLMLGGEI